MIYIRAIFLLILSLSVVSCVDYCDIEKRLCGQLKHIGCDKNEFNKTLVRPYDVQPMTDNLKRFILNELNTFRSDVAMGKYESEGLPKASNMRSMRWNEEFGQLAELSIKKVPLNDFRACVKTEEYRNAYKYGIIFDGSYSGEIVFRKFLRSETTDSQDKKSEASSFLGANNYQIACKVGTNSNSEILVKCIQNDWVTMSSVHSYKYGVPCSECFEWDEVCDDIQYPGLCVPKSATNNNNNQRYRGDVRDAIDDKDDGSEFQESELNYSYPASFWVLYTIMGLGVTASILISLKIIPRRKNRKPISILHTEFQ